MHSAPADEEVLPKKSVVDYKKSVSRRGVLAELYQAEVGTLAQLAKNLHSSVPSITNIVEELVEEKWVTTFGTAVGNHGRRPVLFGLNPQDKYILALDISTHDTKVLIMNMQREVIFRRDVLLGLEDSAEFTKSLLTTTQEVLSESGMQTADLVAIGISMPGLIHYQNGTNMTYRRINQEDKSLSTLISEQFGLPVYVINDTKATVLGEHRFGLARGKKHVLAINIDWGVGLGIILNGEIFQGAAGFAGELGHIQIDPDGELCHCGKVGCLDTITSARSLGRRVQRGLKEGRASKLSVYLDHIEEIDIEKVIEAALEGDAFAIDILFDVGTELGKGLSMAVHLFNPEIVIVDGIVVKADAFITNPIGQAINKYCLSDFRNELSIEISQLGERAKWVGIHIYVMDQLFATV
ncbi:sugar kinase [Siphonobacter sp. BAB-5385]|uniref:ROK family transcriptional regulator n=1 Tax=unclassified Siphonobacter TaxID=2635712 RepID=UPI000B9EA57D|nr:MULTISPECIES: ROK family transcriptional regulator [unclassified Siphonobacter]OZI08178.1 sugar kinase [Siphonobacter sp. BAB-5385]PMD95859.1 sugar kinase [Siphonobacter sp. BAB-5405]